jgi:hypothetical protein
VEMGKVFEMYYERKICIKKEGLSFFFDYLIVLFQKILHRID